ncbi:MAG: 1-acyl-sn-glycerol-3-phosphate acyltransferase [Acidobacteria bacterium]|nr:1-acyl-sn-glycerol-3-phosphate acyltransferase [Acidobacteriota bacterium]
MNGETFHLIRTVFFLIPMIGIYTIVLGILSIGSSVFDRRGYFAHGCARLWSWLILATTGVEVAVEGLERLERGRTYVFVANHQSIYDIPVIFWWIPFQLRIIAKESLGRFPMLGPHLKRTGHMLVDRSRPDRSGIFGWANALTSKGLSLIVFPEGTRSADGRVGMFKGGSFYLAVQAGLPIVPLSIVGSRHVMRKGRLTTKPGFVRLIVHEPIETAANPDPATTEVRDLARRVREIVRPAPDAEASSRA